MTGVCVYVQITLLSLPMHVFKANTLFAIDDWNLFRDSRVFHSRSSLLEQLIETGSSGSVRNCQLVVRLQKQTADWLRFRSEGTNAEN